MAEKIVFGADIDNVTIKNVNGVLVAVGGSEAAEDEVETLSTYTSPVEDDEHYVETTTQWLRHKPTQAVWSAKKSERKPRATPVNESISEAIELEPTSYNTTDSNIRLELKHRIYTSGVDGKSLGVNEINSTSASVDIPKSQYANAKAFNEANAGKTFTVTTKKRYAESEGHPVVKPIEIQVAYPTLPFLEGTAKVAMEHSAYLVVAEIRNSAIVVTNPEVNSSPSFYEDLQNAISNLDVSNIKMRYELLTSEGNTLTGEVNVDTDTYRYDIGNLTVARNNVPDYINHSIKHEKWSLDPITLEGFYTKFQITFEPYVEEAFDTL